VGGVIMIVLLTVMLRAVMTPARIAEAKRQADLGLAGRMEGHAAMDMSVGGEGSILERILSPKDQLDRGRRRADGDPRTTKLYDRPRV
jgi:uncharacterized protein